MNNDKVSIVIKGMTREQARTFCSWYEGQGEQDQGVWFEVHDVRPPTTDVQRKGGYLEEIDDVLTMYVK